MTEDNTYMTGELANVCGTTVRTVQYYDQKGLLAPSGYSEGGRRMYADEDAERLRFILMLKALGLKLSQIRGILESPNRGAILETLLEERASQLEEEIAQSTAMLDGIKIMQSDLELCGHITMTSQAAMDTRMNDERARKRQWITMIIVGMDTVVALMAGLCVIPGRFALDPTGKLGGPSLLFVTMQNVFSRMGGAGPIFGILFYLLVVFAAISSSISLLEVIVAHFVDKARDAGKGDKRKKYTLIATVAVSAGCILVCADALGSTGISPADLLGITEPKTWAADWLDFWDCVSEGIMMPLGALLMTFMVAYELGTEFVKNEVEQCGNKFTMYKFYRFCIRYVAPLGLLMVLYGQVKSFFF